jgi:hypothetical protein
MPHPDDADRPLIDVSPALGEAGHETELLGYTDVEDSGAVLKDAGAADEHDDEDPEDQILRNIATRGVGGVV